MVHMQPPAADLQLPYSSEWDLELIVTEHWNTTNSAQGSLRASAKVRPPSLQQQPCWRCIAGASLWLVSFTGH
jgi:hypothetical protein